MQNDFDSIWEDTIGTTLDITEAEATVSNGMNNKTANDFAQITADLTDDQVWEILKEKGYAS